ncbi:uncharacterized protein A1O5_07935 [Cladophialophora psammophila CBS 110553]|uniref:Nucleoside phosphorylase domain-containing protein n=1 Tax=Cladophialophora psammophila CBS 110553 TaxID=1182543 RepID=W9WVC4_9EURO|nr:uncharacterized protein A1O5_07935 [Cladophialophora psammophila CBS 110553]EXJ69000.1 hypothetical protein A1O5_07935 [Cladophialophora psammophila CBS 110553]
MPAKTPRERGDFEIALICALPLEAECVQELFDKFWEDEGKNFRKAPGDPSVYTTGVIGDHNAVLAYMPGIGTTPAAAVAGSLRVSFPNIKLALVVGVCGGMPYGTGTDQEEIMLGDVIISQALLQYDFGRRRPRGFVKEDIRDTLGRPSPEIRAIQAKLRTSRYKQKMQNNMTTFLQEIQRKRPEIKYRGQENDILYHSSYIHRHPPGTCDECKREGEICELALKTECEDLGCDSIMRVKRSRSMGGSTTQPVVHFGIMASGNTVMASGQHRDLMAQADGIIGFEMEGAGVWDYFPSVVIKGVCDYTDSHKRKGWQRYAAATAAACAKAFLVQWSEEEAPICSEPVRQIPFDHLSGFIGRTEELKHLQQAIFDPEGRRIVSLLDAGVDWPSSLSAKSSQSTPIAQSSGSKPPIN